MGQIPEHFIGGSILLSKGGSVQVSAKALTASFCLKRDENVNRMALNGGIKARQVAGETVTPGS